MFFERHFLAVDEATKAGSFHGADVDENVLRAVIRLDEAVAFGAAVQGGIICGDTSEETESLVIIDATPLSLGIETVGGVMTKIIPKGSFIPTKKQQTFTTYQDN